MTRTRRLLLPTAILALAMTAVAHLAAQPQGSTPEALMGAAQHQEEVEGNLAAAIATYRKVADNPKAPRALAAAALLQVGRLHEKLGSREATRAYERIAKDFTDQPTIVAQARSRLAALGVATAAADDGKVVARQVWSRGRGDDALGSVSGDGRQYAFVDWTGPAPGNVAIRDLATGEVRRLTTANWSAQGYAEAPSWSPDGKHIAYVWNHGASPVIRIVAADGTGSKELFRRQDTWPYGLSWSPDGRMIAVTLLNATQNRSEELAVVSVQSGQVVRSWQSTSHSITLGGFSPEGRHVVFALAASQSTDQGGLHSLSIDSGATSTLLTGPGRYAHATWSPDGQKVVFLSDRSGALGLWVVSIADGKVTGEPQLLRPNTGNLARLAFSRSGTLWYGLLAPTMDVYVCDFDPARLVPLSVPTKLTDRFLGANFGSAWSPDGRQIAYLRGADRRKPTVVVRNLDTGAEREVTAAFNDAAQVTALGPTWLPDSRALLVPDVNRATKQLTVHRLDVESSQSRVAFEANADRVRPHLRVSPDGRALYFSRLTPTPSLERGTLALVRRDVTTGVESELYRAESLGAIGLFGIAVSPDGSHVAVQQNTGYNERAVVIVPTAGGDHRAIYRGDFGMPHPFSGAWTPDGRHLLLTGWDPNSPSKATDKLNDVWVLPIDGGEPRALGLKRRGVIMAASLSPDGRRLTFTGSDVAGELWSLKNLLGPAATPAR